MLSLVPLSAFGLSYILQKVTTLFPKSISKYSKVFLILIIIVVFSFVFTAPYEVIDSKQVYSTKVIDDSSYNALLWFKENYGKHNVLMTPIMLSSAVYPLIENYVVSVPPGQVAGGNYTDNKDFYEVVGLCPYKKSLLDKHDVDFVIANNEIGCNYLAKIYNQDIIIYSYKK